MKTLPVLREKKRYIAFEVISSQSVNRQELWMEIVNSVNSLFGDKGMSEINAGLLSFDGKYGLLRCQRDRTTDARAALACVNRVRNDRVSIAVLGISGTVRGATEKFIQQNLVKEPEPEKNNGLHF
ncbi:Ribonuclease P protein component 2 [uncultured archaeon]|nr:Ribonuclease P protein component 2 [uncultured archaeon]